MKDKLTVPNRKVMIDFARAMAANPNVRVCQDARGEPVAAAQVLYSWCVTDDPELFQFAFTGWQSATGIYYEPLGAKTMHGLLVDAYEQLATYAHVHRTIH